MEYAMSNKIRAKNLIENAAEIQINLKKFNDKPTLFTIKDAHENGTEKFMVYVKQDFNTNTHPINSIKISNKVSSQSNFLAAINDIIKKTIKHL